MYVFFFFILLCKLPKWRKFVFVLKYFLGTPQKNTSRLQHRCHCKRMVCLSHSDLRPQVSISGPWACHPCLAWQWRCFWMPTKGLRQRSWRVGERSPPSCRVLPCWGYLLSEAHVGSQLSPRQPGPAHKRVNITSEFRSRSRKITGGFCLFESANKWKCQRLWVIMIVCGSKRKPLT